MSLNVAALASKLADLIRLADHGDGVGCAFLTDGRELVIAGQDDGTVTLSVWSADGARIEGEIDDVRNDHRFIRTALRSWVG